MKTSILDKYVKDDPVIDSVTTTIKIAKEQKIFVDKKRINLSELVRDVLDDLMKREKK